MRLRRFFFLIIVYMCMINFVVVEAESFRTFDSDFQIRHVDSYDYCMTAKDVKLSTWFNG